ncbi:MAG: hypothetical protein HQL27_00470 [Candidatus Omnitrophica bacterium]|nr:hypothetical protein [Candidatus Omnitrophota bacterium]
MTVKGVECAVGIFRDATERRTVEELLEKAKDSAELANKSKSDFLNSIAPDLRTLVHVIQGFSSILQEEDITDRQKSLLDIIDVNSKTLYNLADQIMDVSKLESKIVDLIHNPFDMPIILIVNK